MWVPYLGYSIAELKSLVRVDEYRGLVYLVAAFSGMRRNELSQLEWRDVDFQADCIRMRSATTKNGKDAVQATHPNVMRALKAYRSSQQGVKDSDKVFAEIPSVPLLKRDLKACGIEYVDEYGRYADFHSFRHTYCTMLSASGVDQRIAQTLMRHSDPRLTANVYTDESLLPLQEASLKLPSIETEWTHKRTHEVDGNCRTPSELVASSLEGAKDVDTKKPLQNKGLVGVGHSLSQLDIMFGSGRPTRTRT